MKTYRLLLLIVVLALMAVLSVGASAQEEPFRVAVVSPSAINDLAFTQSMYDALIARTALTHGLRLLTRDRRARGTYDVLGVDYRIV